MALHQTTYDLFFEHPQRRNEPLCMRVAVTTDFPLPQDLARSREQSLAMLHMGSDWQRHGYALLDIQRVAELGVSVASNDEDLAKA